MLLVRLKELCAAGERSSQLTNQAGIIMIKLSKKYTVNPIITSAPKLRLAGLQQGMPGNRVATRRIRIDYQKITSIAISDRD